MEVAERADELVQKGSVRAALTLFGEKLGEGNAKWKKTNLLNLEQKREHSVAKVDANRFPGNQNVAEKVKSRAQSKLLNTVDETLNPETQIRRTNKDFSDQKNNDVLELSVYSPTNQYIYYMMKELESTKEEIRNLKTSISHTLEEKSMAETRANEATAKGKECSIAENRLRDEIGEANEELVLVELAKMEAKKELHQIETERDALASLFSYKMSDTRNKINELLHELRFSEDIRHALDLTNSEIEILQNELQFCKAMEKTKGSTPRRKQSSLAESIRRTEEEDLAASSKLASSMTELDQAKKELQSLREEGFHVMTSMDIIRNELRQISSETARWGGLKEQSESKAENLNSRLIKAKKELEIKTKSVENAKSMHSNLLASVTELKIEKDVADNEKQAIDKEIQKVGWDLLASSISTNESERRLQEALHELEELKDAEITALENLSILSEKVVMERAASSQRSPFITISRFEFEYLTARADGADEIANKKVEAAKASVDAVRYAEKEIIVKTRCAEREIAELKMSQEQELDAIEKTLAEKKVIEADLNKWKTRLAEEHQLEELLPEKIIKEYSLTTSVRRVRAHRTPSPAHWNYARSPSFSMKKKKKMVIPSVSRLFKHRKHERGPYYE